MTVNHEQGEAVDNIAELQSSNPGIGRVEQLLVRPARRAEPIDVPSAIATAGLGLTGDHRATKSPHAGPSLRQVTLIMAEHLDVVASLLGRPIAASPTRRNVVVRGINLGACRDRDLRIGEVVVHITGPAHPCSRMEQNLGPGGYQAMRGHGGMTATITVGGTISVGDHATLLAE